MSSRATETPEELVAGPERVPGTRQIRQPVVVLGIALAIVTFGAVLWLIAVRLGGGGLSDSAEAQTQAPRAISSAQPARTEDIAGHSARSMALPSPQPPAQSTPPLPQGDLNAAPITTLSATPGAVPNGTSSAAADSTAVSSAMPSAADVAAQATALRHQHQLDEERAAAQAPLQVAFSSPQSSAQDTMANAVPRTPLPATITHQAAPNDFDIAPASEYLVKRGMIVAATLYTSIDSTVGGTIIAYVNQDIYDYSHRVLVWPRGSKLIGTFGGQAVIAGQARVPVAFDSIELTNGHTIELGNMPGTDLTGTAGFGAKVDNHTRALFTHVVLLSMLSAGAQLAQPRSSGCSGFGGCAPTVGQTIGQAVGQTIAQTGATLLARDSNVEPTLHVVEGAQVAVIVQVDIPVTPWAP